MTTIEEVLAECKRVVDHPYEEIDKHIANGKKVIGVMPYYIPEELVYAAGAIPFGVWGCRGTPTRRTGWRQPHRPAPLECNTA